MSERPSRRERKKLETRRRLMEAALQLFREQGYDDTTVEQIAEAVDVAKGTFFNYFDTKEAILPAMAEWRFQRLEEVLSPERGAPASPIARIKLALRLVAEDPLADPVMARRLIAAVGHRLDLRTTHGLTDVLAPQIREAQVAGEIRADLSPVYLGDMIRALFFQQLLTYHCGPRVVPLPELLDRMVETLLAGIAGPNRRQTS